MRLFISLVLISIASVQSKRSRSTPRSSLTSIFEIKGDRKQCPDINEYFAENHFLHFPNLKKYPLDNYRIKYKQRNNHIVAFIQCKRVKKRPIGNSDLKARQAWENEFAKGEKLGKFRCYNNEDEPGWSYEWDVPECADRDVKVWAL